MLLVLRYVIKSEGKSRVRLVPIGVTTNTIPFFPYERHKKVLGPKFPPKLGLLLCAILLCFLCVMFHFNTKKFIKLY